MSGRATLTTVASRLAMALAATVAAEREPALRRVQRQAGSTRPPRRWSPKGPYTGSNSGRFRPSDSGSHATCTAWPTVTASGSQPTMFVSMRTPSAQLDECDRVRRLVCGHRALRRCCTLTA